MHTTVPEVVKWIKSGAQVVINSCPNRLLQCKDGALKAGDALFKGCNISLEFSHFIWRTPLHRRCLLSADRLIFWQKPPEQGVIVDAAAESERLKENATRKEAPTKGKTPTIVRKPKGWLEGIIN